MASSPIGLFWVNFWRIEKMKMKCKVQNLPQELLVMIIERLNLKESAAFCEAINISVEWAYQYYHTADHVIASDFRKPKAKRPNIAKEWAISLMFPSKKCEDLDIIQLKPNLSRALLKHVKFQSFAASEQTLAFSIQTQDPDKIKQILNDPKADHDKIDALKLACRYGQSATVKLLVDEYRIKISTRDNVALYEASVNGQFKF